MIKNILLNSSLFITLLFISVSLYGQKETSHKDSLLLDEVLSVCVLDSNNNYQTNQLHLKKRQAKKIAKMFLYSRFGRIKIWTQFPIQTIKYNNYWIFIGKKHNNKRYGGVFTVVINSENGCVECITHGK